MTAEDLVSESRRPFGCVGFGLPVRKHHSPLRCIPRFISFHDTIFVIRRASASGLKLLGR